MYGIIIKPISGAINQIDRAFAVVGVVSPGVTSRTYKYRIIARLPVTGASDPAPVTDEFRFTSANTDIHIGDERKGPARVQFECVSQTETERSSSK